MTDMLVEYVEWGVGLAHVWGPLLIFIFMAIESSLVPFPSEVIMIPAGVLIARGEFWGPDSVGVGFTVAILAGLAGSMAGAYFNYYMAMILGRPILHKYGKYFFLSPKHLDRAEEVFREYGAVATFVCRLLPAIRQLISIPAGLSRMNILHFSFFTGLGAGIWVVVLTTLGYFLGAGSSDKEWGVIIHEGKDYIHDNLIWVVLAAAVIVGVYVWVHKKVMDGGGEETAIDE